MFFNFSAPKQNFSLNSFSLGFLKFSCMYHLSALWLLYARFYIIFSTRFRLSCLKGVHVPTSNFYRKTWVQSRCLCQDSFSDDQSPCAWHGRWWWLSTGRRVRYFHYSTRRSLIHLPLLDTCNGARKTEELTFNLISIAMLLVATILNSSSYDLQQTPPMRLKGCLAQPVREGPLFESQIIRYLSLPEKELWFSKCYGLRRDAFCLLEHISANSCLSSNPQYLRMWLYLERGYLKRSNEVILGWGEA